MPYVKKHRAFLKILLNLSKIIPTKNHTRNKEMVYFLQKSLFLKMDLRNIIHAQDIVNAGKAAVTIASTGDILENINGLKNIINVINIVKNNVIRSNILDGGVKKILAISIFTFIFTSTFLFSLLLVQLPFLNVLNLLKYLCVDKDKYLLPLKALSMQFHLVLPWKLSLVIILYQ